MPIYAYECGACGAAHDFLQKMSEGPKRKCPSCGERRLKKQVTAAAFHLKGTGWYATDFRDQDKKKTREETKEEGRSEGKAESTGKSESGSSGGSGDSGAGSGKGDKGAKGGGKSPGAPGAGGRGASTPAD